MSNSLWNVVLQSWVKRGLLLSTLEVCLVLLISNVSHHRERAEKLRQREQREPRELVAWSVITFTWCISAILLWIVTTFPFICPYTHVLIPATYSLPHIALSFYQLARLKATFNTQQNREMAYPQCVYVALSVYGYARLLLPIVAPFVLNHGIQVVEMSHYSGCYFVMNTNSTMPMIAWLSAATYFVWDWLIVGLYVYKLRRIQLPFQKMRNKIRVVLKKILFLTAITEVTYFCVYLQQLAFTNHIVLQWGQTIGCSLDLLVTFGVMYLMLDHNDKDYLFVLQFVGRCGCLRCCCCCFGDLQSEYNSVAKEDRELELEMEQKRHGNIYDDEAEEKQEENRWDSTQRDGIDTGDEVQLQIDSSNTQCDAVH